MEVIIIISINQSISENETRTTLATNGALAAVTALPPGPAMRNKFDQNRAPFIRDAYFQNVNTKRIFRELLKNKLRALIKNRFEDDSIVNQRHPNSGSKSCIQTPFEIMID